MVFLKDEYLFTIKGKDFNAEVTFGQGQSNLKKLKKYFEDNVNGMLDKEATIENELEYFTNSFEVNLNLTKWVIENQFNVEDSQFILDNSTSIQSTMIRDLILASWQGLTYNEYLKTKN